MVTQMCLNFGWSVEYVLSMPVRRFFAMRNMSEEIKHEERSKEMLDLCEVQAVGGVSTLDAYTATKNYFNVRAVPIEERARIVNPRLLNMDDDKQNKIAADALKAIFRQKAKLEGLH